MINKPNDIIIRGAKLIFRNFAGKAGTYNPAGNRNFCVLLDPELAEKLADDGWSVKFLNARNSEDEPQPYIPVKVKFDPKPPKIYMCSGKKTVDGKTRYKNKVLLTEDTVAALDYADIENVDIDINPYVWTLPSGGSGISAYVKTMYVTIADDEFEDDYELESVNLNEPDELPFV